MTMQQYITWFDDVVAPTGPMFRRVPPDRLGWKPTESSFTLGQQLGHIPGALLFFAGVLNGEQQRLRSLKEILLANRRQPSFSVDEALIQLDKSVTEFKKAVQNAGDLKFQTGLLQTPQFGEVVFWRYCFFALEHHIHHLMELHICLKLLGIKVNTLTLYSA
jgi:uncharacterized damage-inducible protein DinB